MNSYVRNEEGKIICGIKDCGNLFFAKQYMNCGGWYGMCYDCLKSWQKQLVEDEKNGLYS